MHYVYVLQSKVDGKFYTGYTTDLEKRLTSHISGEVYSTKYKVPLLLVYDEASHCRKDALHRERYLKTTYGRRYIRQRLEHYLSKTSDTV
jgi:putative endonuclease